MGCGDSLVEQPVSALQLCQEAARCAARRAWPQAKHHYQQALDADPTCGPAMLGIARANASLGLGEQALAWMRLLLDQQPQQPDLWCEYGSLLLDDRQAEQAVAALRQCVSLAPQHAIAWNNLGSGYQHLGQLTEAARCYATAAELRPDLHAASWNLGMVYSRLGKLPEARQALQHAAALDGNNVQIKMQLGDVLERLRMLEQAYELYQQAAREHSDNAIVWAKTALVAKKLGHAMAARDALQRVQQLAPSDEVRYLRAIALPVVYKNAAEVKQYRQQYQQEIQQLVDERVQLDPCKSTLNTTFLLAYQNQNDRHLQQLAATLWAPRPDLPRTSPDAHKPPAHKLRVGFLSSFFKQHTIGKLTRGWIAELDREQFHVTVLSPYKHDDALSQWIQQRADRYVVVGHDASAAARQVAAEQLDVLVYPEIGMDPVTLSLARWRLAPVQCVTWGHPVTTGLPTIDYYISSALVEPEDAAEHYSEQLVQLQTLPAYYYRPAPVSNATRAEFGISQDARVYLCPQSLYKFHPDFDILLRRILEQDSRGLLVLIEGQHRCWTDALMQRFRHTLGKTAQQVRWLPALSHDTYLRLLSVADVLLDTPGFGGGNTNYEAFAVGTPIVTWPSGLMRGRVALGMYHKMGLHEAVAQSADQYVQLAVEIANNPARQANLRRAILQHCDTLYEDRQSVEQLQQFLLRVGGRDPYGSPVPASSQVQCNRLPSKQLASPPKPAAEEPTSVVAHGATNMSAASGDDEHAAAELVEILRESLCPACGHHVAVPFFNPGELPLATLAWPASRTEAMQMKRLPHEFVRCVDCGHVYNARFQYADVPYSDKPNLMFNRGAIWTDHLRHVHQLLLDRLGDSPTVVEIGCGDGHILRALAAARPRGTYIGFDPNCRVDTGGGVFQARRELFDPAVHLRECQPDLLISRHVLEHLMNPLGFIQAVAFAVSWTGRPTRLFIEVPCIDHVLHSGRTVDFFYEHNSHFTTKSLERMLARCAGQVELVETSYHDEVVYGLATFQVRKDQRELAEQALAFRHRAQRACATLREQLDALYASGRRVAIWGGTGKAAAFIQQHGIDADRFPLVVDSDPDKSGTFVPGGGQRIEYRDLLLTDPANVILIATQWRAADIVLEMQRSGIKCEQVLIEHQGRLVDYYHDEHPYRV